MGIERVDAPLASLVVEDTEAESAHLPAGNAQRPQHDVHGGRKILAEAPAGVEQKVIQRPDADRRRRRYERIGKSVRLVQEPGFDRLRLIVGRGRPSGLDDRAGQRRDLGIPGG